MRNTLVAKPIAEYQIGPRGSQTSIIVADLAHPSRITKHNKAYEVDARDVARQIAPYIQKTTYWSAVLDSYTPKLARDIARRPQCYSVTYTGKPLPEYQSAFAGLSIATFAYGSRGYDLRHLGRYVTGPYHYYFEQFGMTRHEDARRLRDESDDYPGSGIFLLAGAAHLDAKAAQVERRARRLCQTAELFMEPHQPDETRSGYFFEQAGFEPVNPERPWRRGGMLFAHQDVIRGMLLARDEFSFLRPGYAEPEPQSEACR